jgi:hypothetical protein
MLIYVYFLECSNMFCCELFFVGIRRACEVPKDENVALVIAV